MARTLCKTVNTVRTSAVLVVQSTLESFVKVRLVFCHKSVITLWSSVNSSMHGFVVKLTDIKSPTVKKGAGRTTKE